MKDNGKNLHSIFLIVQQKRGLRIQVYALSITGRNNFHSQSFVRAIYTSVWECYAICEKDNNTAIGAIELMLNGHTDMTERDDECELGYWIGQPFWGRGYVPEAAEMLLRRAFQELGMTTVWCGYYDGNQKSKRVQEKLGFVFHHTCNEVPVPLLNEVRIGHTNALTKKQWENKQFRN